MDTANPSDLARETLKTLATRKIPPTPENYCKIYAEISGAEEKTGAEQVLLSLAHQLEQNPNATQPGIVLKNAIGSASWDVCRQELSRFLPKADESPILTWPVLIRDLLQQLDTTHKGLTLSRKKEGLNVVLTRFANNPENLFEKLNNLLRSWSDSAVPSPVSVELASVEADEAAESADEQGDIINKVSELLAQTLESMLSSQPELLEEVQAFAKQARTIKNHSEVTTLAKQLRPFWIKVELRGGDKARIHEGLIHLLRLLVENIGEMVEDEEWLSGQITILQSIIANPIDKSAIADAERNLRNAVIQQGLLKQSMTEAKITLKGLMTTFIDRLGEITNSTGNYHQKIEGYSEKIKASHDLNELGVLLEDIMYDTRIIQTSTQRSHEELLHTRKQAQDAEEKIRKLEKELAEVSELVHQDQLTGALNRRGLDDAFEREATRADRSQSPICIALLDIDNFKRLNDTLGHQAGDQALVHLSGVIKEALRPSDRIARYGGEEFVIILPDIEAAEAALIIERLQRELTKKYFLNDNDRVLITFSAGVAQRTPEEPQEEVIARADKAMYQAKKNGKNRVVIAG